MIVVSRRHFEKKGRGHLGWENGRGFSSSWRIKKQVGGFS